MAASLAQSRARLPLKNCNFNLRKRSFRARHPSKTSSLQNDTWRGSYSAGSIREWSQHSGDRLAHARQTFPIHLPRHVWCRKTYDFAYPLSLKNACRARLPSKNESSSCENEAFVRDILQKLDVEHCSDNHCSDSHCSQSSAIQSIDFKTVFEHLWTYLIYW